MIIQSQLQRNVRDALFNVKSLTDAANHVSTYTNDPSAGWLTGFQYPGGDSQAIAQFDPLGRPGQVQEKASDGTTFCTTTFEYHDPEGLLTYI